MNEHDDAEEPVVDAEPIDGFDPEDGEQTDTLDLGEEELDVDDLDDGEYTLTIKSDDGSLSDSVSFELDVAVPVVELTATQPVGSTEVPVQVDTEVTQSEPEVLTAEVLDGDDVVFSATEEDDVQGILDDGFSWPTVDDDGEAVADGEYTVRVTAEDEFGDTGSDTVPVAADNTTPEVVEFEFDTDTDITNDEVTLTAEVESATEIQGFENTQLDTIQMGVSADFTSFTETVSADSVALDEEDNIETFEVTIDAEDVTDQVGDGEFNAFATTTDELENESVFEDDGVTVEFDTTIPDVSIALSDLGEEPATATVTTDGEDVQIVEENDITIEANDETRDVDFDAGLAEELEIEFDGTPLVNEDETTFEVTVDVEDEAGNQDTGTADATIAGFDIDEDLTADVETGLDSNFELNPTDEVAEPGDEGDLTASETTSNPTDTELAEELIGAQFIDMDNIAVDEENIDTDDDTDEATITVDLGGVDIDGVDDSDPELAGIDDGEFTTDAAAIQEQEVVG